MEALKVTAGNERALAAIAESLRRRSEQTEPAYSTRLIIDACFPGTIVTGRALPTPVHEMVLVDAAAFRSHRAPHVVFYSRALSTDAQRYAIAHAIAHIIFDGGARRTCGEPFDERELRCDAFADELLVPLERLREYIGLWREDDDPIAYWDQVDQISSHFHVPQSVVHRRISGSRAVKF